MRAKSIQDRPVSRRASAPVAARRHRTSRPAEPATAATTEEEYDRGVWPDDAPSYAYPASRGALGAVAGVIGAVAVAALIVAIVALNQANDQN